MTNNDHPDLGETELIAVAEKLVRSLLRKGHNQGHQPKTWLAEPLINHALKAARHATTAQLMECGWQATPDSAGEDCHDHLERAAMRSLMALAVYERAKQ